jgi:chromate transporter
MIRRELVDEEHWVSNERFNLTFGGAYTVIPFLQRDAVVVGAWMTNAQFLDGIALSGILPAPLIIFRRLSAFSAAGHGARWL